MVASRLLKRKRKVAARPLEPEDKIEPVIAPELVMEDEPEEFLVKVSSGSRLFAPDQREEIQIRYREALSSMPVQPGLERGSEKHSQP